MKHLKTLAFLILVTIFTESCSSTQKTADENIYGKTWELEYLSGPRIAFEGLFPDKKPMISFNKETQKVEGNAGCNGYSADFTINGDAISFEEPGISTMMYCGEGEPFFLKTVKLVNKYKIDENGKLNLMIGDVYDAI
ncbi:META domain-containing protein [Flavobacterium sp. NRK F10]|uniref:META domain-containing protein n=1 Tax=Flavobacterium sp. NRK F10 TaxID=2954931 RepID=UPI0020904DA0|nr:META domain-containing protein [Flavobacterium sp. NRK F10]MCO6176414.1 META domain-containing protein [Flavobacterium sp. NRK F10]